MGTKEVWVSLGTKAPGALKDSKDKEV